MRKLIISIWLVMCLVCVPFAFAQDIDFTEDEQMFIQEHPTISIGVDPHFVPFEFIDSDGSYKGIAYDYIKIIEEKTGLEFVVTEGLTWNESYERAVEKTIDILPSISKTNDRERYFLFSDGYYEFQRVIVMEETVELVKTYKDLFGQTVAVQKNSSHHSFLKDYPEINLSFYGTTEDALKALANGNEDYFVGNLATSSYIINDLGITQTKYIVFEGAEKNQLHFAVRDDWPELQGIINKVLSDVTKEEKIQIHNRWIGVKEGKDYTQLIRTLLIIGAFILVGAMVSIYWIIRLRREIKKRIKIEEELKVATQVAKEANDVKSTFLARMSHEIRTPLNAITGLSYLVLNTDLTKKQRSHIEKLKNASDTMLSIINDILDFSKIEAGKIELEDEAFELDQVIRNTMNIIAHKVEEKKLHFTLTKDPSLPNYFFGDSTRIGQILLNLLNNAIKFTHDGDIALNINLYGFERDIYQLEFVVSDTGIGMSNDHLVRLFEPFNQEDASISRRFGGSGLGLSIVKNLVELMDGQISVESTVDKGSEFRVRIKLKVDSEREGKAKKGFEYIHDIKTLILNNNMNSLSLIISYLKSFSIDAEFTSSEAQFSNIVESNANDYAKSYDLLIIFCDSTAHGCGNMLDEIKRSYKPEEVPKIILIYPFTHEFEIEQETEEQRILLEPFLPSMLYNLIAELFKYKVLASQVELSLSTINKEQSQIDGRVLIVEDNITNQMIAKELLNPLGLTVDQAYNGEQAIKMTSQNEYNLILMDLHMPIMNGFEATGKIRESSNVPIIAMTADAIEGVKEKCIAYGMNDFISKPFIPEEFIKKMYAYFNKKNVLKSKEKLIDTSLGLKLMGGNTSLYKQVQIVFLEENSDTIMRMETCIEKNAYKEASELVHKVKSSAGSLGSEQVRITANVLQEALVAKDEKSIPKLMVHFKEQFELLMSEVEAISKELN